MPVTETLTEGWRCGRKVCSVWDAPDIGTGWNGIVNREGEKCNVLAATPRAGKGGGEVLIKPVWSLGTWRDRTTPHTGSVWLAVKAIA